MPTVPALFSDYTGGKKWG